MLVYGLAVQADGLQAGSDQLERMGHKSADHPSCYTRYKLVDSPIFELLVKHVVKTCKRAFFDARSKSPGQESLHSLLLVNIFHCPHERIVPMKISKLISSFDNA